MNFSIKKGDKPQSFLCIKSVCVPGGLLNFKEGCIYNPFEWGYGFYRFKNHRNQNHTIECGTWMNNHFQEVFHEDEYSIF